MGTKLGRPRVGRYFEKLTLIRTLNMEYSNSVLRLRVQPSQTLNQGIVKTFNAQEILKTTVASKRGSKYYADDRQPTIFVLIAQLLSPRNLNFEKDPPFFNGKS